jgi:DNA-binding transcriptional LysR family regulator
MNTKSLRTFIEVSRSGSFSAAARNMGLTQPAVSFQIRSLEKEYGSTLIDRSGGRCTLTDAGASFLRYAQRIVKTEEELQQEMELKRSEVGGSLAVAASNIPGEYIMPSVLAAYKQLYPFTDPRLTIADSGEVLEYIRAGETDLGCVGYREEDDRLEYGVLCSDRLVFIAPPDHPLSRRQINAKDLEGEVMLWREKGSGTRSHMTHILSDLGLEQVIEGSMKLGSTMAVIQAVAAGAGLSLVSLWAAGAYLELGKVAALKLKGPELRREFYYVLLRRRPASPATTALLQVLQDEKPGLEAKLESISPCD